MRRWRSKNFAFPRKSPLPPSPLRSAFQTRLHLPLSGVRFAESAFRFDLGVLYFQPCELPLRAALLLVSLTLPRSWHELKQSHLILSHTRNLVKGRCEVAG